MKERKNETTETTHKENFKQHAKSQAHEREPPPPSRLALTLDLERYLGQLDDWHISDDQKTEFIASLWGLLLNFAELGYEIHPAQTAQKTGRKRRKKPPEKTLKPLENISFSADDVLYSKPYNQTQIIEKSEAVLASEESETLS